MSSERFLLIVPSLTKQSYHNSSLRMNRAEQRDRALAENL